MKTATVVLVVLLVLLSMYLFGAPMHSTVKARTTSATNNAESESGPGGISKSSDELLAIVANLDAHTLRLTEAPVTIVNDLAIIDRSFACAEGAPISTASPTKGYTFAKKSGYTIDGTLAKPRDHQNALTPGQAIQINVFVTKNGEAALKSALPRFPLGTVVLKQKILKDQTAKTLLYTGMLKREPGYNSECGDWEFFTVSGDGKNVTTRGKLANCMECHKDYPASDYITKTDYSVERKVRANEDF